MTWKRSSSERIGPITPITRKIGNRPISEPQSGMTNWLVRSRRPFQKPWSASTTFTRPIVGRCSVGRDETPHDELRVLADAVKEVRLHRPLEPQADECEARLTRDAGVVDRL